MRCDKGEGTRWTEKLAKTELPSVTGVEVLVGVVAAAAERGADSQSGGSGRDGETGRGGSGGGRPRRQERRLEL